MKYTKQMLEEAVKNSTSLSGVIRALGKESYSGALSTWIRGRIQLFGIDSSHFTGNRSALGKVDPKRKSAAEIFVVTDRCPPTHQLRRALREHGVSDQCSECGCTEWRGKPLVLDVHHADGNRRNNQPDNLRLLCPNCHSQTPTFGRKPALIIADSNYCVCGQKIGKHSTQCLSCATKKQKTRIEWPSVEVLIQMTSEFGFSAAGRTLGVSDNAIRKRIKRHGSTPTC